MAPSSYAPPVWAAVVSSDRAYYDSVQAASGPDSAAVPFPSYYAERRFRLAGSQMRIGRRSVSRGIDPEIDLTGPPVDPGISRLHAVLIATPDGGWAVLDPGSANGTLVNGTEIPTGVQVPCMTATASTSAAGPRSPPRPRRTVRLQPVPERRRGAMRERMPRGRWHRP